MILGDRYWNPVCDMTHETLVEKQVQNTVGLLTLLTKEVNITLSYPISNFRLWESLVRRTQV